MSDWATLSEDLLLGLVHALNNRVTALSAVAELSAMDGEPMETPVLRKEVTRLVDTTAQVGWLASRAGGDEALEVKTILDIALAVHEHHPGMRAIPCVRVIEGAVLPVRVPRWALFRTLLLMVDGAKRDANAAGESSAVVKLSGDDSHVRVVSRMQEPPGEDAHVFASRCGATLAHSVVGDLTLEIPSLLLVRRNERAGRG